MALCDQELHCHISLFAMHSCHEATLEGYSPYSCWSSSQYFCLNHGEHPGAKDYIDVQSACFYNLPKIVFRGTHPGYYDLIYSLQCCQLPPTKMTFPSFFLLNQVVFLVNFDCVRETPKMIMLCINIFGAVTSSSSVSPTKIF